MAGGDYPAGDSREDGGAEVKAITVTYRDAWDAIWIDVVGDYDEEENDISLRLCPSGAEELTTKLTRALANRAGGLYPAFRAEMLAMLEAH